MGRAGCADSNEGLLTELRGYDYRSDPLGERCLHLSSLGKAATCFGAVLIRDGKVIAEGRNRRSLPGENELLGGGVDYATHAEQAAVIAALQQGIDVCGCDLYVIGQVLRGERKGQLSVRASDRDRQFSCVRCARMFARLGINAHIPLPSGWHRFSPEEALASAEAFRQAGRTRVFTPAAA